MKECDLVMKGGVTSGVVYPELLTKLSKEYRFKQIGGTSAGAIAAGICAAAEFNRATNTANPNQGFDLLEKLPLEIGTNLANLFQASKIHKKALKKLLAYNFENSTTFKSLWLLWKIRKSIAALPETSFGMCTGLTQGRQSNVERQNLGLTDWLNHWIEMAAGRMGYGDAQGLPDTPLLFKYLEDNDIKLKTITSNLSERLPVNLPNLGFALIKVSDLEELMPENIVKYIKSEQPILLDRYAEDLDLLENRESYLVVPEGPRMPVLLAVRMSLSFPLLLTAVPMYRFDYSKFKRCENFRVQPSKILFSDGGITSNFPIHLFDSAFPTRPTFGVSLDEYDSCRNAPDIKDPKTGKNRPGLNRIALAVKAGDRLLAKKHEVSGLFGFAMSIFNTAQTWQDINQTLLPGYRERIAEVSLKSDEGGLNLDMNEDQVRSLVELGGLAAETIKTDFSFDEHRWRRLLSSYSAIEEALGEISELYAKEVYSEVLNREVGLDQFIQYYAQEASSYKDISANRIEELRSNIGQLARLNAEWSPNLSKRWTNGSGMPKPAVSLKFTPNKFLS